MAIYTFDQFEKAAKAAGLYDQFSAADLNLARQNPDAGMSILKYKQDYAGAATDEARALANMGAEQIRSSYGNYTGGGDGGSFHLDPLSPSSFQAAEAPKYESRYDDQLQQTMQEILDRAAFAYNAETDPLAAQYRKTYTREGQRATQDAMGQAAAASGGLPSSWAATAAAQAGNYYAGQMADKVPELEQIAYNRYLTDQEMKRLDLSMLQSAEETDYSKFLNELQQYNTDRNFAYEQLLDEIGSQSQERSEKLDIAQLAAEHGDYSRLQEMGINTENDPTEWQKRYELAVLAAEMGDYSGLRALGIEPQEETINDGLTFDQRYKLAELAADFGDYSHLQALGINVQEEGAAGWEADLENYLGGKTMTREQADSFLAQNPDFTEAMLQEAGFVIQGNSGSVDGYRSQNAAADRSGLSRDAFDASVRNNAAAKQAGDAAYRAAIDDMQAAGAGQELQDGLLTRSEWQSKKNRGTGGEETVHDSYEAYVSWYRRYVEFALSEE